MKHKNDTIYPLFARIGHRLIGTKKEQALSLWEHFRDEEIETYTMKRLSTVSEIFNDKSPINDIVMLSDARKFGLDYDYKRELLSDGTTKPHATMESFYKFRAVTNTLRDKKGIRATPQRVKFYADRAKLNVRQRGGNEADCIRHFCKALVQGIYPFNSECAEYKYIANRLRQDFKVTVDKLKNAKRTPFSSNVVFNNSKNRSIIKKMLIRLGYERDNNYKEFFDLLIHKGLSNPVTMFK